jgi:hypothetical protein
VDDRFYRKWEELVSLISTVTLSEEEDALIWQFNRNGVYSSQSLYSIINFRGWPQFLHPSVWRLIIPPRVHFFLWLLSKNKLLARDNLEKRRKLDDSSCLFYGEKESVAHLFFECVVARKAWEEVSTIIGFEIGSDFESAASCWLCNKKIGVVNVITSVMC